MFLGLSRIKAKIASEESHSEPQKKEKRKKKKKEAVEKPLEDAVETEEQGSEDEHEVRGPPGSVLQEPDIPGPHVQGHRCCSTDGSRGGG